MAGNTVTLRFVGDTRDISRSFNVVASGADRAESRFARFSSRMKTFAGIAGTAIALDFARTAIDAFKESEAAQSRLEAAFAKFPALANSNIESLRRLNTELSKKTRFDDDATASGQAVLASFKLTGDQIKQLTPLLQDYASRTGKDLPTAAQDLGKALLGQGRALKGIGVDFKDLKDPTANFNQLMGVLNDKVGGFAEKEGKTAAGQAEILKNQFGELQEKVGSVLVPALTTLANKLLAVVDWFQKLPSEVQTAIAVLAGLAAAIYVVVKAIEAWRAAQILLNATLFANPIGLFVLAIIGVVAALVLAYHKVEWFRNAVDRVFRFIRDNWQLLAAGLAGPFGIAIALIVKNFDKVRDAIEAIIRRIKDAMKFAGDLLGKIPGVKNFVTGAKALVGKIPGFATGGTVPGPIGAPMLAVVHGGETVTPPGEGSGSTYNLTVYASGQTEGAIAGKAVVDALKEYERLNGGVPIRVTG